MAAQNELIKKKVQLHLAYNKFAYELQECIDKKYMRRYHRFQSACAQVAYYILKNGNSINGLGIDNFINFSFPANPYRDYTFESFFRNEDTLEVIEFILTINGFYGEFANSQQIISLLETLVARVDFNLNNVQYVVEHNYEFH